MAVLFHLHMLIPFKFFYFLIHFQLRRCTCRRRRYPLHFFSSQPLFLFHLYHNFFFTSFSLSSALSCCYLLFIINCVWQQSTKQKNTYKLDSYAYSGSAAKIKTRFTLSTISNIEATYLSVPCFKFLERSIGSLAPCRAKTGTIELVFICFCNIYVVCVMNSVNH